MNGIPVLVVSGYSLAIAYEKALIALYRKGMAMKSQYDRSEGDFTIDSTMNITVDYPLGEPMIHKAFPGGIEDLKEYTMELRGLKDHWQKDPSNPDDKRWDYTYHWRFAHYGERVIKSKPSTKGLNQIAAVVNKLVKEPYTRQAQMITWIPTSDLFSFDPPCVQSVWYRLSKDDGNYILNCNVRIRSNDAWGAAFMNMFGFTIFNKEVIVESLKNQFKNKNVLLGRLNWQADSFHIYGKDIKDFKKRLLKRVNALEDIKERVWRFEEVRPIYEEAEKKILMKVDDYDRGHKIDAETK